ncbi:MAG: DUF6247 family protein [Pseudonocardiaceae bacterium]
MTAEPVANGPQGPGPEVAPPAATPGAIRQALLPEEVGQFDSEWRTAMSRSAESLDLTEVYTVLRRWRGIAALTQADPDAHRRMLRRADQLLAGQGRGSVTADQMLEMVARRLG